MVKTGATEATVKDTTCVVLEHWLVSLDIYYKWLLRKSSLHLCHVIFCYIRVPSGLNSSIRAGVVLTSRSDTLIWILKFGFGSISLVIIDCYSLVTTVATAVRALSRAVNELLL